MVACCSAAASATSFNAFKTLQVPVAIDTSSYTRPCFLQNTSTLGAILFKLCLGIVGKRWCSICLLRPPVNQSLNMFPLISRVDTIWHSRAHNAYDTICENILHEIRADHTSWWMVPNRSSTYFKESIWRWLSYLYLKGPTEYASITFRGRYWF